MPEHKTPKRQIVLISAGDLVKQIAPIVGGGGGGRPQFAQAGGKDASKIADALNAAKKFISDKLG